MKKIYLASNSIFIPNEEGKYTEFKNGAIDTRKEHFTEEEILKLQPTHIPAERLPDFLKAHQRHYSVH